MDRNDQNYLVEKIRTQYLEKEATRLDALRALDKKVKRPVHAFTGVFAILAALVMGCGMSLVMTDIGAAVGVENSMFLGIVIGLAGLGMGLLCLPIYRSMMKARRKKYAAQIVALSNELLK